MDSKYCLPYEWEEVTSYVEKVKPKYGSILIELIYHQNKLKKVKIIQKDEYLVFEKKENNK